MPKERRPRIPEELATRIDALREDTPFERYIHGVLERHADRLLGEDEARQDMAFMASRVHMFGFEDPKGAFAWIDRLPLGGWGADQHPDVMAGLVIDDEDYDTLGIYLKANDLRGLRDAITEILNDGPWNQED